MMDSRCSRPRLALVLKYFLFTLLVFGCINDSYAVPIRPVIVRGVVDISDWDFSRDGVINLKGPWEFHWNDYIDPGEKSARKKGAERIFVDVPRQFDQVALNGKRLDEHGFATYRLHVKGAVPGQVLGIKCPLIMTAYRVWIDGRMIESVGVPGTGPGDTVAARRVSISYFSVPAAEFDITIHAANFHFPVGGIKGTVYIGGAALLQRQRELNTAFSLLTMGSLFIMAMYHLGLYLYRRNDYSLLFFSLMSLLFSFRFLFVGEVIFSTLFPDVPWAVMLRLETIDGYLACLAALMFYHSLYPRFSSIKATAAISVVAVILCASMLIVPTRYYSITLGMFLVLLIALSAAAMTILVRAAMNNSRDAVLFIMGFLGISLAAIHDVLVFFSVFDNRQIIQYVLFLFIVYQAFILSRRFSRVMSIVEHQKTELYDATLRYRREIEEREKAQRALNEYRNHLEKMVSERTREITRTNERLQGEIRERSRMEEELAKASKIESLGVFAGGIAHDFNNLLTSILGNISMAKISDMPMAALQDAENASLRAKDLTRQLLTFASGGAPIKKIMSVRDLLRDTIQFALSGSSVLAVFSLSDDVWSVEVDHGQISQVIHNIVINSIQAMPEGGVISVEAENEIITEGRVPVSPGRYVRIALEDTGPGIPPEITGKIFDPYFTTKSHGTGLGLSICYSVVSRHKGHISVEHQPGDGARFIIYLPASMESGETARFRNATPALTGKRILVMDDEESVLRVTKAMLKHMGASAEFAHNGEEAVYLYGEAEKAGEPFDLVIMDLTIPGAMGGKEAVKKLIEIDRDVRAIVSSGYSNDPVMADFRAYGFRGVLAKPFTFDDLVDALKKVQEEAR